ncbi:hypothetical protein [Nocardia sp. NPDC051570]|uniref:hypothetical protein n=1 Tax=Nocardia sp. NPDC051570 TaxID=3364324 RepID=UPI0037961E88
MRISARLLLVLAALILLAIMLFRCGTGSETHPDAALTPPSSSADTTTTTAGRLASTSATTPTTTPTTPGGLRFPAPFDAVNPSDPSAVLAAASRTLFSYQSGDATQADAAQRAAPLLAHPVDDSYQVLAPITGAQWRNWMTAGDRVVADVQVPARNDNPDQPTIASRVIAVTQHVLDPQGKPVEDRRLTAYATVTKDGQGVWRVTRISVQQ